MLLHKQHNSSTRTLNIIKETKQKDSAHNGSQSSMVKIKRPPLSNIALLRSQSNLSLYTRSNDYKEVEIAGETTKLSSISKFKSPDITSSSKNKFISLKSDRGSNHDDKSFNMYEIGKENIPQNSSIISNYKQNTNDVSYLSNNNHLATAYFIKPKQYKNDDLKDEVDL